jgi:putative transposase
MLDAIEQLSQSMSVADACSGLGFPRSNYYRLRASAPPLQRLTAEQRRVRRGSSRSLAQAERAAIRAVLNSERFMDSTPYVIYATLLDEGSYLCSVSTMYRILREHGEVRERRDQRNHPVYKKPELLATRPNELWSWDISWLRGPSAYSYYYLYVILDVFSRYVVGWTIEEVESAEIAHELIAWACRQQRIQQGELTLHADNGSPMKSIPVTHLLEQLGVAKSHSRPYVSNDNPFSEAQFKTMKYQPDYPERFDSQDHARGWARAFFPWYNFVHLHSGIGYISPAAMHFGQALAIFQQRQEVLHNAFAKHPERFVRGQPHPPVVPTEAWINKPPSHCTPEEVSPFLDSCA